MHSETAINYRQRTTEDFPTDSPVDSNSPRRNRSNDASYIIGTTSLFLATSYFFSVIIYRGEFTSFVVDAGAIFGACCSIESLVLRLRPKSANHYVLVHFILGFIQHAILGITYLLGVDIFLGIWRPLYFGVYFWDIVHLICRPQEFFPMFRLFYTIHHTVSFFITGTWVYVSACCPWEEYIIRGIAIWLTSEIYLYIVNIYRGLCPGLDKSQLRKLQLASFILERIQRCGAYLQALIITSGHLSALGWVVFGTGICNDGLDAFFQAKSLFSHFAKAKQKTEGVLDPEDIEGSSKEEQTNRADNEESISPNDAIKSTTTTAKGYEWRGTDFESFTHPSVSNKKSNLASESLSPFEKVPDELQAILMDPLFNKTNQWELSSTDFQKLSQQRLKRLAGLKALEVSNAPGLGKKMADDRHHDYRVSPFHDFLEAVHYIGAFDMSLFDVLGVHCIGGSVIFIHGSDEQQHSHGKGIDSIEDVYCFGGTELAHGSNLKQVQTKAVYDEATEEFILTTDSPTGAKYWIGNATFVADYMVVLSKVIVSKEECGVAWFRVPLWQKDKSKRFPGVDIRDIGTKAGCNGIGNGCIMFRDVRVPRQALLQRFCQVSSDGTFTSELSSNDLFLRSIQTFVLERIGVATAAIGNAKVAVYAALRYASVRRQFGPNADGEEVALIQYPMHQRRLLTHTARLFASKALLNDIASKAQRNFHPYTFGSDRKALHALSCLIKAFGCWESFAAAQEARECCGGHGFAAVAQVGMIRNDLDVTLTFAGDNSLLALEVVRFRLKQVQEWSVKKQLIGPKKPTIKIDLSDLRNPSNLLCKVAKASVYREETMLLKVGKQLRDSRDKFQGFLDCSYEMREVASAVYDQQVVSVWRNQYSTDRNKMYQDIGMLQALLRLNDASDWYLARKVLSSKSVLVVDGMIKQLCDSLATQLDDVLEAFKVPTALIGEWPLLHEDYCDRLYDLTISV